MGGLPLANGHGHDPGPDDFRGIGPFKKTERQYTGGKTTDIQNRRHDEIKKKYLHQKRGVTDGFQVDPGQQATDQGPGKTKQGNTEADTGGEQQAEEGYFQGNQQATQQRPGTKMSPVNSQQVGRDGFPVVVVADAGAAAHKQITAGRQDKDEFPHISIVVPDGWTSLHGIQRDKTGKDEYCHQ